MAEPVQALNPLDNDPLLAAVRAAPMGAPLSPAERAAMDEGKRSILAGERGLSQVEIERLIEQMQAGDDDVDD